MAKEISGRSFPLKNSLNSWYHLKWMEQPRFVYFSQAVDNWRDTILVCFYCLLIYPFKRQHHKKVKYTETIRRQQPTNCLSVFDHFVKLVFKG